MLSELKELRCPKCGAVGLQNQNTHGVYSCGTKAWPKCSDMRESFQCVKNQLTTLRAKYERAIKWLNVFYFEHNGRCPCCNGFCICDDESPCELKSLSFAESEETP